MLSLQECQLLFQRVSNDSLADSQEGLHLAEEKAVGEKVVVVSESDLRAIDLIVSNFIIDWIDTSIGLVSIILNRA